MSSGATGSPTLPVHVTRFDALLQGGSVGVMTGLVVFVATNWLVLKGGTVVGPHLALLAQFLVGYEVTFVGSLIGLAWGFVYGFAAGYAVSVIYNLVAKSRTRADVGC